MFIQTEQTPNPATLKFLPGREVLGQGIADFRSAEDAAPSPLAVRLFAIPGVTSVFLGGDFVTVTKADDQDWQALKPLVLGAIMEHFVEGRPVMEGTAETGHAEGDSDPVVAQIKELLDTRVRPAVAGDGGDITFVDYKGGIVYLAMRGSCSGCPSSAMTLKSGIENLLKHFIPEITEVRAVPM